MATIRFLFRGKKDNGNLTIRLIHTKEIDIRVGTKINSKKSFWFQKTTKNGKPYNKHRRLQDLANMGADAKVHKEYLEKVRKDILKRFNADYNNGVPISKEWLKSAINDVTGIITMSEEIEKAQEAINVANAEKLARAKEKRELNLVTTAVENIRQSKYGNNKSESCKYNTIFKLIKEYEGGTPIKIKEVNQSFSDKFTAWAKRKKKYKVSTLRGFVKRIRMACIYAYENDEKEIIEISRTLRTFKLPKQKNAKKKKVVITLDYAELKKIEMVQLPKYLENARKVILIGCETGLRFSDYNELKESNIKRDGISEYWEFYSQKTDSYVRIPKTERIVNLIEKYGFPKTEYTQKEYLNLNEEIKNVCRRAGIDDIISGQKQKVIDVDGEQVKRGIRGDYPKYSLIATHTMRRSFATNFYGKISTEWIREITGHSTDAQLMDYINKEKVNDIDDVIEKLNALNKERDNNTPILKVVNK